MSLILLISALRTIQEKVHSDEYNYVWPDSDGNHKGIIVTPLLPELSKAVKTSDKLFLFLNVVEIFRGLGGVRHLQEAQKILKSILIASTIPKTN